MSRKKDQLDRIETIGKYGYDKRGCREVEETRSNQKFPFARHAPCSFPSLTHAPKLTSIIRLHVPHIPPPMPRRMERMRQRAAR